MNTVYKKVRQTTHIKHGMLEKIDRLIMKNSSSIVLFFISDGYNKLHLYDMAIITKIQIQSKNMKHKC